jgi:hypothetical protein
MINTPSTDSILEEIRSRLKTGNEQLKNNPSASIDLEEDDELEESFVQEEVIKGEGFAKADEVLSNNKKTQLEDASFNQAIASLSKTISTVLDDKFEKLSSKIGIIGNSSLYDKDLKLSELMREILPKVFESWIEANEVKVIKVIEDVAERQISEAISKIKNK